MANSAQARKRVRQAEKRRRANASTRSMMRTYVKKTQAAIDSGDKAVAETCLREAVPIIDRVARVGLVHANKAARTKRRLNRAIQALD